MILVDTGPLVALLDRRDSDHDRCVSLFRRLPDRLITTVPVLTEVFHLLSANSSSPAALREFIRGDGLQVCFLDRENLERTLELMQQYQDHPMDMADASLIAAAEKLEIFRIFTLDRKDFNTYRIRKGHRLFAVEILP